MSRTFADSRAHRAEPGLRSAVGRALFLALLLAGPLGLAASRASAQTADGWSPSGAPVASSVADRVFPVAVADGEGGAFVVWQEYARIRLQRLNADGAIADGWPASQGLAVCSPVGHGGYEQSSPRAVADESGGLYVLWHDERNSECAHLCLGEPKQIFLQRVGADGAIAEGWPALGLSVGSWLSRMSPTPDGEHGFAGEMNTVMVPDRRGGVLVAWIEQNLRGGTQPGLHVQRVSPRGELLWGDRGLWLCAKPGAPQFPAIVADGAGGATVAWEDVRDPAGARIYVQRVSATGMPLLRANGEIATRGTERNERYPQLCTQARDGAMLVWQAGEAGGVRSLWARRLRVDPDGPWLPEVKLTATAQPAGTVSMLADMSQGAWVSWVDVRAEGRPDVYVQHLLRVGKPAPGWPEGGVAAVETPSTDRTRPHLAGDGAGEVFVGWRDENAPRVTLINPNGRRLGGWPATGLALTNVAGVDRGLDLVFDGRSGVIGVWDQWMSPMGVDDVRAQRVGRDRSALKRDYRIPPGRNDLGETPRAFAFALEGLHPNPSLGPVSVAFTLPSSEPASIAVFDVAGRRVADVDLAGLGAGRHVVRIDGARSLEPGVYVIRLTQGERTAVQRGIVTR